MSSSSSRRFLNMVTRAYSSKGTVVKFRPDEIPYELIRSDGDRHRENIRPKLFAVRSTFPENLNIPNPFRMGTAFLVSPNLLLTSSHVIGHVTASLEPDQKLEPADDRFDHAGRIVHKSYLANTFAFQRTDFEELKFKTTPLAVNFGAGLAVLEVEGTKYKISKKNDCCEIKTDSIGWGKGQMLFNIALFPIVDYFKLGIVGDEVTNAKVKGKVPWPLDDKVKWMEISRVYAPGNPPPPGGGALYESGGGDGEDGVTGGGVMCSGGYAGSPWVNFCGEIVGMSSWEMGTDKPLHFPLMYAVPSVRFKDVLDYANSKGSDDPVVMDSWVDSR